jgi:peptidoglycan hydrolase CwlO-like protein
MKSHLVKIVALTAILALTSWASSNLAADLPDAGQKEIAELKAQVTQLQERVAQLETRVDELFKPKLHPAGKID